MKDEKPLTNFSKELHHKRPNGTSENLITMPYGFVVVWFSLVN